MLKLTVNTVLGLLLMATLSMAQAEQQTIRVIPKTSISNGSTGSISESRSSQQYDVYGGQRVPSNSGSVHQQNSTGSQSFETRGGIRQTTVYPGGYEVERTPGRSSYEQQRTR